MLRDRLRSPNAPLVAHVAVLALALIAFLVVSARESFFSDDWFYVTQQQNILWAPHVGHWDTVPVLIFLAIQRVFGMDHYLPYAVPSILAHLGVVHLIWRISVRVGVRPWMATAFGVLLTFLGAGAESIDWAVQVGFVGAMTGLLGAILLLEKPGITRRRGGIVALLVLLSLASSEVAIAFIVVAVVLSWIRHGLPRTIAVFVVPFVAFLTWYLIFGRRDPSYGRASGVAQILQVPQFAIDIFTVGVGRMFPVVALGGLLIVAVAIWWIFSLRSGMSGMAMPAYLLFAAAPIFAMLTGFSRVGNGFATATSSRYVYVVVIAMTPLLALGYDRLTRRVSLAPAIAVILILALWNVGGLAIALNTRIARADSTKAQLATTAATLRADPNCLDAGDLPSPQWAPNVLVGDVSRWLREGWYHPAAVEPDLTHCDAS
jgi:hypothetical protein